jgi:hypothetical protein
MKKLSDVYGLSLATWPRLDLAFVSVVQKK